ncbi:MAG TPA: endonuclease domain-containing protein, partial [Thermoanaerobaculia bacterium]
TNGESLVWRLLRDRQLVAKFRRQHRLGRFILDFYCPELRLGLEIDGAHHTKRAAKLHDEMRSRELEALNIRIERFSNDWVRRHPELFVTRVVQLISERREEISKQRSVVRA